MVDTTIFGVISLISIIAGIISILFAGYNLYLAFHLRKEKINQAKEENFRKALESDDLETLGNFLERDIGNFTINEYVSDDTVNLKVNSYFERLQVFLSTPQEIRNESPKTVQLPLQNGDQPLPNEDYKKILNELNFGDTWNSLARLRRTIEVQLKDYARANEIQIRDQISAGQMLNILKNQNKISDSVFKNLKFSVSIANNAIHGKDVSYDEAQEAITHARIAIEELNRGLGN
ncbi:hypothetical protein [Methanoregula sp. UBA64]|jgi:hypothetical protein|uniref:hypothetical protein n=1 Tax=Methanoregula sp. UBA64 TaxID=1915554 RepID=UPI0025FDCFB2|nr:hypothetical protein [Methanoregula sp. UBA64]